VLSEVERPTVEEVDSVLPRIQGVDAKDGVLARSATACLARVLQVERQVEEAAPASPQSKLLGAPQVAGVHADVQELGRPRGFTGLDLDRVSVERTDLAVANLVARSVASFDGGFDIRLIDRLAQALLERADDVRHGTEAVAVEFEVELLRLVPKHVRERAGDAFDQCGMRHALQSLVRAGSTAARRCRRPQVRSVRALRRGVRGRGPPGPAGGPSPEPPAPKPSADRNHVRAEREGDPSKGWVAPRPAFRWNAGCGFYQRA